MKLKYILSGALLSVAALWVTSCDDDLDYTVRTGEIVSSITTGEAHATAVSAELRGTVKDLNQVDASFYEVGAYYSTQENPLATGTKKTGTVDESGNIVVSISGLTTGETYHYIMYVTLKGTVSYYGEAKSFVATQAKAVTLEATDITYSKATFTAEFSGIEGLDEPEKGVKLALEADKVSEGKAYALTTVSGLLPGTTYYYAAFVKVGGGYVYGETLSFTTETQAMEYVDLGLSVLWASCNIGADVESEAGALVTGTATDVLASLKLDGDSPMQSQLPTSAHIAELLAGTTQEQVTVEGVEGMRFTAANGNSIFLPAAGYQEGETAVADGKGYYWSGTPNAVNAAYGNTLAFAGGTAKAGSSSLALALSLRTVRPYAEVAPEAGKVVWGDLEGNGRLRIEIYNEYGATAGNPPIDPKTIKFQKNMVVNFTLSGIDGNLKPGAKGSYTAGLEYSDPTWGVAYWSSFPENGIYETTVTGDGTYNVWMEVTAQANGAVVFCVDIDGLSADLADPSLVGVTVNSIKLDADVAQAVNSGIVCFNNKDGNGTDGRIEIYNEYSTSGATAPGYYNGSLKFNGLMLVEFTISGIDGNLQEGAAGSYNTELSFADADWYPSYWGGAGYGNALVTGDGTYQVYTHLQGDCVGAVVWTIELYGLWKDLVDDSKVSVRIDKVVTPGKN